MVNDGTQCWKQHVLSERSDGNFSRMQSLCSSHNSLFIITAFFDVGVLCCVGVIFLSSILVFRYVCKQACVSEPNKGTRKCSRVESHGRSTISTTMAIDESEVASEDAYITTDKNEVLVEASQTTASDSLAKQTANPGFLLSSSAIPNEQERSISHPRNKGKLVSEIHRRLTERLDASSFRASQSIEKIADDRRRPWEGERNSNNIVNHLPEGSSLPVERIIPWTHEDPSRVGDSINKHRGKRDNRSRMEEPRTLGELLDERDEHFDAPEMSWGLQDATSQYPFEHAMESGKGSNESRKYPTYTPPSDVSTNRSIWGRSDGETIYSSEIVPSTPPDPIPPTVRDRQSLAVQINIMRTRIALSACDVTAHTAMELERRSWQDPSIVQFSYAKMVKHAERALSLATELQSDGLMARAYYWLGRAAGGQQFWDEAAKALHNAIIYDINSDENPEGESPDGGLRAHEKSDVHFLLASVQARLRRQDKEESRKHRLKDGEKTRREAQLQEKGFKDALGQNISSPWRPDIEAALQQAYAARRAHDQSAAANEPATETSEVSSTTSTILTRTNSGTNSVASGSSRMYSNSSTHVPEIPSHYTFTKEEINYINGGDAGGGDAKSRARNSMYSFASPHSVPSPKMKGARHAPPAPIRVPVKKDAEKAVGKDSDGGGSAKGNSDKDGSENRNQKDLGAELEGLEFGGSDGEEYEDDDYDDEGDTG